MASETYIKGSKEFADNDTDWAASDIRYMLVAAGFTPDKTDAFLSDVAASRYGGLTQADDPTAAGLSCVITATHAEMRGTLTTFPSVAFNTGNAIGVVAYRWVTTEANSPVLAYDEFTVAVTPDGNNIDYTPAATGVFRHAH